MSKGEDFYPSDELRVAITRFHRQLPYLSRSKVLQLLVAKGLDGYHQEWQESGSINIEMPDFEWFE